MNNGYARYQENSIMTASPAKILLMAYDGAIKFCRIAGEKMQQNKYEEQGYNINRAVAIICELMGTLKEEVEPTLVARLRSLYTYVLDKLNYANINQDIAALNESIKILSELREAWADAEKSLLNSSSREAAA